MKKSALIKLSLNSKPGSVSTEAESIIYLGWYSHITSINLPIMVSRRSSDVQPLTMTYLVFQLLRFTPDLYRYRSAWALTSRFHLFPPVRRIVIFCGTGCLPLSGILPVRKQDALRCPDFPPLVLQRGDGSTMTGRR